MSYIMTLTGSREVGKDHQHMRESTWLYSGDRGCSPHWLDTYNPGPWGSVIPSKYGQICYSNWKKTQLKLGQQPFLFMCFGPAVCTYLLGITEPQGPGL